MGVNIVDTYVISEQQWIGGQKVINLKDLIHLILKAACKDDSEITNQDIIDFIEHQEN